MSMTKGLAERIGREARSYELVEEGRLLGRKAFKIKDEIFLHLDVLKDFVEMDVALPPSDYRGVLSLPFAAPHKVQGPPWVTLKLQGTEPFNLVRSWIRKSYELRSQEATHRHRPARSPERERRARKPARRVRASR
jgi:hypothetical protein